MILEETTHGDVMTATQPDVGVAPRGQADWLVSPRVKAQLIAERTQVEGGIGTIKCGKYGFNRPSAHSAGTMGASGQRAVLGFNLNKLVRGLAERRTSCSSGSFPS